MEDIKLKGHACPFGFPLEFIPLRFLPQGGTGMTKGTRMTKGPEVTNEPFYN